MTEPPPSGIPRSEEPVSRRKPDMLGGVLPPSLGENADVSRAPKLHPGAAGSSQADSIDEEEEGPLSRRLSTDYREIRQAWPLENKESPQSGRSPSVPPEAPSQRVSSRPLSDAPPSRRPSVPPPMSDGSMSRRWGDTALLSGGPTSKRWSEPPPSFPISGRSFDAPVSGPPVSDAPLSMRVARVSGGAGPGYRLSEEESALWLKTDMPGSSTCRVLRLGITSVWFVNDEGVDYVLEAPVRVTLMGADRTIGPLLSQVVAVYPADGDEPAMVGLQLIGVSLPVGRNILNLVNALVSRGAAEPARSLVMSRENIEAPDRVKALLYMLIHAGGEATLRGGAIVAHATRIENDPKPRIKWRSPSDWGDPPFSIEMVGYNSIHRLTLPEAHREESGLISTPFPSAVERIRHRWFRRVPVRGAVTVHFRHTLWPELLIPKRQLKDISYAGLSFETDRDQDLVFPGLELTEVIIEVEGGLVLRLRGQIRFVSQPKEGGLSMCGMSVTPRSVSDEPLWTQLVSQQLHGTLKSDVGAPEPVWSLFESSGYFQLSGKSPAQFEPLKSSFLTVGERAVSAPRLISQVVWPSQRGIEASISLMKVYHGSWMVHQLAKRPGKAPGSIDSRQILRDIYLRAMEHPQFDPDFHWMFAYVDATVHWSRMCHLEFAQRHESTGLSLVRPFRLIEVSFADMVDPPPRSDIQTGTAEYEEEELLITHLRRVRPEIFTEALDFTPDLLQITMMTRLWRENGFDRERAIFVARRRHEPIAMAVAESGESGTNLFRLLDSVRLFAVAPGGEDAFPYLLSEARSWYQQKGKAMFVYFHEPTDDAHLSQMKLKSLGEGALWVIHALLLPDFIEHVYELTAPNKKADESAIGRCPPKPGFER